MDIESTYRQIAEESEYTRVAHKFSDDAHGASDNAMHSHKITHGKGQGNKDFHNEARSAHMIAHDSHGIASRREKDRHMKKYHDLMSDHHHTMACFHANHCK